MTKLKYQCLLSVGILILPILLTTTPITSGQPRYGGILIAVAYADPVGLNPILVGDGPSHCILTQIFDALVVFDEKYEIKPALAESWEISEDGLVYTFHLRQGVKWHDGEEFTSADVKYTFDIIIEEKLVNYFNLQIVDTVKIIDKYTVEVTLKEPAGSFLSGLVGYYWGSDIIPAHLYEGTDVRENPHNLKPIGTGAFKFVEWVKGSHIILEANKDYWGDGPYLDKLIFKVIPDRSVGLITFEAGEADYLYGLATPPAYELPRLEKMEGVGVYSSPGFGLTQMGVNIKHPTSPISDIRVRKAMFMAIDRETIVGNILPGAAIIGTSPLSSGDKFYYNTAVRDMYPLKGDIEEANRILDEAGYKRGPDGMRFTVEVLNRLGSVPREDATTIIKSIWAQIGIDLRITPTEFTTMKERLGWLETGPRERNYELATWGSTTGPDPDLGVYSRYHSTGSRNFYNYENSRVDELMELGKTESNLAKRKEYYYEVQEIMMEDLPLFPLWEDLSVQVYRTEFKGLPNLPMGYFTPLNRVWWIHGESLAEKELAGTVESITTEVDKLTGDLLDISNRLEATSKDLAESISDVSASLDSMATSVDAVRNEVTDDLAKLKSTVNMLQTLLAVTLIVAIISAVAPFMRKSTP